MRNRRNGWLAGVGSFVLALIAGLYLTGRKESGAVHADTAITTEKAAAQAGAKVLPTDPKLKVEPK
jgi:hypothetical protein